MKFRRGRQRDVLVEGLESRVLLSAATALVFRTNPGSQTIGSVFGFTVAALDSSGHVATSDNAMVTLTFAGPTGGMLNGTKKVALHHGVGTFQGLSVTGAGVYKMRVSQSASITTQSPLVVGVAGLVISTPPTTGGWQTMGSLTIGDAVKQVHGNTTVTGIFLGNANGNVTIEMTSSGAFNTTLPIVDTVRTGNLTPLFLKAGSVATTTLSIADLTVSQWTFSGGTFAIGDTVQQTANGTVAANGTWLGQSDGNYTIEVTSGRFTSSLTITDTNSNVTLSTNSSNATTTTNAVGSSLPTVTNFSNGTAGTKVNLQVTVVGANGTISPNDKSKITLVIAAGSGAGTTLATATASHGVATFTNVPLTKAGVFSIKAVSGKESSAPTNAITINAGVPTKLHVVSTFPPDTAATRPSGSFGPIVVDILDSFGNVVRAPSELTLTSSTVRGWSSNGTLSVNDKLVQTQTSNGTASSSATGTFLGTDASGDFLIQVTSGQFNNTNVINDSTSGATLTPNSAAAFPSSDSTVTAILNSTLPTTTTPGKITQAANGTATSVNGVANITLTSAAGTAGPNLALKPGYYTLIVSDGVLTGETFQVHVA